MDIGFNTSAVRAHLTALFDFFLVGVTQKITVDHFPGLIADGFNVSVQSRFFKPFFGNPDTAKPPEALRIDNMKGQFLVCESKKNSDNGTSEHLIGAHTLCPSTLSHGLAFAQILQKTVTNDRVSIDDAADYFQLLALLMIKNMGHQGYLFLPFFAHFVVGSFSVFVVLLNVWRLLIYYKMKWITTTKCAFLFVYK